MLLNHEQVKSIKNRQVTFVKSCNELNYFKNHKEIFDFLEFNDVPIRLVNTTFTNNDHYFSNSGIIQIEQVQKNSEVNILQDLIYNLLYKDIAINYYNSHIFMALKSGSGMEHVDIEDVHLFGLFGNTVYRVYYDDEMRYVDYELEYGDYLFVPNGLKHRSISKNPRAILSIGYYFA